MQKKNLKIATILLTAEMFNLENVHVLPEGTVIPGNAKSPYVNKLGQLALANVITKAAEDHQIEAFRFRATKVDKEDKFDLRVAVLCPALQSSLPGKMSRPYSVNQVGEVISVPEYPNLEDGTPDPAGIAYQNICQAAREYISEMETAAAIPENVVTLAEGSTVILKGDKKQELTSEFHAVKVKENTKTFTAVLFPTLQDAIIASKQLAENPEALAEAETVRLPKI